MTDCLFCKIAKKEIPANVVYEDPDVVAFLDIKPVHPGHTLVIAKAHSTDLTDMDPVDLQAVMSVAQRVTQALLENGYDGANVSTNVKPAAGQVIFHTHVHVVPRKEGDGLKLFPQQDYQGDEAARWHKTLKAALR